MGGFYEKWVNFSSIVALFQLKSTHMTNEPYVFPIGMYHSGNLFLSKIECTGV